MEQVKFKQTISPQAAINKFYSILECFVRYNTMKSIQIYLSKFHGIDMDMTKFIELNDNTLRDTAEQRPGC